MNTAQQAAAPRRDIEKRLQRFTLMVLFSISLVMASIMLWKRVVISIKPGESGVLYSFFSGTDMSRIYGEGLSIIWPWNHMHVYNMRMQTSDQSYRFLTNSGLPMEINVSIRYRPDMRMLNALHVNIGPDFLKIVVLPEVEAVLRRSAGQFSPEEIYTSARGFTESIVVGTLSEVEDRYVLIDDVLVKSVVLPDHVRDAIVRKQSLAEEEKAFTIKIAIEKKEAERKAIEAAGISEYQRIIAGSLTPDMLRWQGIVATRELATSNNAKTVVVGSGKDGLPLILGDR